MATILSTSANNSFELVAEKSYGGTLTPSAQYTGAGAFKTCQNGHITLLPAPDVGNIGLVSNDLVAAKRCFYKDTTASNVQYCRYVGSTDLEKMQLEANTMYWAHSLTAMAQQFLDSKERPPFALPRPRFVDAGLALVYSEPGPHTSKRQLHHVWLLEEHMAAEGFKKYILNDNAVPLMGKGEEGYEMAQYLCFVQHIQYEKTGGLAYVSDFQGKHHAFYPWSV